MTTPFTRGAAAREDELTSFTAARPSYVPAPEMLNAVEALPELIAKSSSRFRFGS